VSGQQTDKQRLIGSWRHLGSTTGDKPRAERGSTPKGIIIYDAHGHVACQVAPDREVTKAGAAPTGEEAKAAFRSGADRMAANMDLIRREEFEALKAEVAALRAELATLKKPAKG